MFILSQCDHIVLVNFNSSFAAVDGSAAVAFAFAAVACTVAAVEGAWVDLTPDLGAGPE